MTLIEAGERQPAGHDTFEASGHALIELQRVSKSFGNVLALQNITTSVHAGEVTCVLGDNGAGKSTFIKILAGVHPTTAASSSSTASDVQLPLPARRQAAGIATVYQDLAMVPLMSIWRNFFLGSEPTGRASGASTSRAAKTIAASEMAEDGHRRARPRPARGHPVGRRAPVASRSPAPSTSAPRC